MNDSVSLDGISTYHVEDQVRLNDQYSVTAFSKSRVARNSAQQWAFLQESDAIFKVRNELFCPNGTIFSYVVEDCEQVILSGRKIAEDVPSAHECEPGASPSSFCV
jgi:hypothetical protein